MADATTKQLKKNRIWVKKQITLDKENTRLPACRYIYSGTMMPIPFLGAILVNLFKINTTQLSK
jgi:hypothetical protein